MTKTIPRHIIFKLLKTLRLTLKILTAAREKQDYIHTALQRLGTYHQKASGAASIKFWKKDSQPSRTVLNTNIFRRRKTARICCRHLCTARHAKESLSRLKENDTRVKLRSL